MSAELSAMDLLHLKGIEGVSYLQSTFAGNEKLMIFLSNFFDPRYAFLVLSPLILSLDSSFGKTLIWTTVLAEWLNQIMKWLMMGERPYWWVHTTDLYNVTNQEVPSVTQFSMTCETGPGSPSGHAMVTAATYFIIVQFVIHLKNQVVKTKVVDLVLWTTFLAIVTSVSVSRVFIAAHFPHQCIYGAAVGVIVAIVASNMDVNNVSAIKYILGTLVMFGVVMATYAAIKNAGINPLWTVDRAIAHCSDPKNVHMDTTPFFSMTRYLGFFLGIGLALNSGLRSAAEINNPGILQRVWTAVLSLMATKASERVVLPKNNLNVFYGSAFAMNVLLPIVFAAVIPYLVSLIASVFARSATKKKIR